MEKISVIIPVYNTGKYVADLCKDLAAQTYSNLEIIFADDGSEDNSLQLLRDYAEKHENVIVMELNHQGVSHARNQGLKIAKGAFIRFLDSDDRIPSDSMEKMIQPYLQYGDDIDLVVGNYRMIPSGGYMTGDELAEKFMRHEEFVMEFIRYFNTFYIGSTCNKLYRKSIIDAGQIHFDETVRWCEDLLFNIEYFKRMRSSYRIFVKNGIYDYINRNHVSIKREVKSEGYLTVDEIVELRKKNALEYCEKNQKHEEFHLYWKYDSLLADLAAMTKNKEVRLRKRYKDFTEILLKKEVYEYLLLKDEIEGKDSSPQLKFIRKMLECKLSVLVFLFFWVKGIMANMLTAVLPKVKSFIEGKRKRNL